MRFFPVMAVKSPRLWVFGLLLLTGCGSTPGVDVSGEVTFDGQPVPAGRVYFNPDAGKGNTGPQGFAVIRNGKFNTREGGRAPHGGATIAVIQGHKKSDDPNPNFVGDPLFVEYQTPIELATQGAATIELKVPASAAKGLPKPSTGAKP